MTFPIRADNEARGLRHYVHNCEVSSVCRSSSVLYSSGCNRTDHQSDSFLPNEDWKVFTQNEISSKTTNLRECTATCPHHRGDVLVTPCFCAHFFITFVPPSARTRESTTGHPVSLRLSKNERNWRGIGLSVQNSCMNR